MAGALKSMLIAVALSPAAVLAQTDTPAGGLAAVAKSTTEPPKLRCEREESIGTRTPGPKVCRTQEEWDAISRAEQDELAKKRSSQRRTWRPE